LLKVNEEKLHKNDYAYHAISYKPIMLYREAECGSGNWKWKRLNFCGSGSILKKEAGSGSKLRSD